MNAALAQHRKSRPVGGLPGHSTLKFHAAVIDYGPGRGSQLLLEFRREK